MRFLTCFLMATIGFALGFDGIFLYSDGPALNAADSETVADGSEAVASGSETAGGSETVASGSETVASGSETVADDSETAGNSEARRDDFLRRFSAELLFYADFEEADALAAAGAEKPVRQSDDVQFGPGYYGQGLKNGKIRYTAENNLDPSAGAVLFWMRVERPDGKVDPKEPNFWPLYIEFAQGQLLAGKMDAYNGAPIYAYLQGHPAVPLVLVNTYKSTKAWKSDDWHLIVVCWQPGELKLSLDGQPFIKDVKAPPLTGVPAAIEIRAANLPSFQVAVDELIILNRPLTDKELEDIWRNYQASSVE